MAGAVGAAGLGGLLFAPVFGAAALLPSVGLLVAVAYGLAEATRWPAVRRWQLPLTAAAGLAVLLGTVLRPTPAAGLAGALRHGLTDAWLRTLQTTWPAGTAPDRLLFVPLLVLLAALLGLAALRRPDTRWAATLPGIAVGGLAQAYSAATGRTAALAALAYGLATAAVLVDPAAIRLRAATAAALPTALVALLAGVALSGGSLAGRDAYALPRTPPPQLGSPVSNPLDEIAERLADPGAEAFRVRTADPVDRWQLVVLDRFDGTDWTPGASYLRLGAALPPDPGIAAPLRTGAATVTVGALSPPWLPSVRGTSTVAGRDPLVDASTGTLVDPAPVAGARYELSWATPAPAAAELLGRPVAPGATGLPDVPEGISDLASAVVRDRQASYGTALLLARYMRTLPLATGARLPTGHGWVQLQRFLLQGGSGTSEQFATGYVVLARALGIPARVVVGYRQPARPGPEGTYVVRNGDVLAWPEVAVQGAGWVAVDPLPEQGSPGTTPTGAPPPPAAAPTRPPSSAPQQPSADPGAADPGATDSTEPAAARTRWAVLAGVLGVLLLGWLAGVPVAKAVRRARRRRRAGPDGVVAAWLEARDQLRAHRVPAGPAMTVRDLAAVAGGPSPGLDRLADAVDTAAWSGADVGPPLVDEAWSAVAAVRADLSRGPVSGRVRAVFEVRSLLPVSSRSAPR